MASSVGNATTRSRQGFTGVIMSKLGSAPETFNQMATQLSISIICGSLTYAVLVILGVPYAGLIALFVGLANLIPLVGATLGAAIATLAAFVESKTAGSSSCSSCCTSSWRTTCCSR